MAHAAADVSDRSEPVIRIVKQSNCVSSEHHKDVQNLTKPVNNSNISGFLGAASARRFTFDNGTVGCDAASSYRRTLEFTRNTIPPCGLR